MDLRREMMEGDIAEFTLFAGTMAQEAWATSPAIAAATRDSMSGHAGRLVPDIEAARAAHGIAGDWSAEAVAHPGGEDRADDPHMRICLPATDR